jgi:hypothetical protein
MLVDRQARMDTPRLTPWLKLPIDAKVLRLEAHLGKLIPSIVEEVDPAAGLSTVNVLHRLAGWEAWRR